MTESLEHILSRPDKDRMISFLKDHPELIEHAVELMLSRQQPVCWRAAWMIGGSIDSFSDQIAPHINRILDTLPDFEDGHQRELIKILMSVELDEDQEGLLYDRCVSIWEQVRKQPSVRYVSLQVMAQTARTYPELTHEILALTQPQYVNGLSPGIRNGVLKLISQLEL